MAALDIIGFAFAMLGGYAFKEELANAGSFTYQRLGQVWDKSRLWYLHTIAAGTWWVLTLVIILLGIANLGVFSLASDLALGSNDTWIYVQGIVGAIALGLLLVCWVGLLPAKRIKNWTWINEQTDELEKLGKALHELEAKKRAPKAKLDALRDELKAKMAAADKEFYKRYGKSRGPMLSILVLCLAPMATGIAFAFVSVLLCTRNGAEMYQALPVGVIAFACYVLGEAQMRSFSGVLSTVLGDAGDAFNRIANAVLIRPGMIILPFITEENYEKIMPKPVEVPFKKAAEAVKGTTLSIRSICLVIIIWSILLPHLAILGLVLLAGIASYGIVVLHKERGLDPKPFVEGSSRLHLWFMMAILFFRIVQLVILGLWGLWWSGDVIWNPMVLWANNLLDDGTLGWVIVGLVIFGAAVASFFASKMKDMKHPFMLNVFRVLTAFFALVAALPLIGYALLLGGLELRLPTMPSNREIANIAPEETSTTTVATPVVAPRAPDAIERMTGRGSPLVVPVVPVPPLPEVPARSEGRRRASARAPVDMCDSIAHASGITDEELEHMNRRHHCGG